MSSRYLEIQNQSRELSRRMRMGTGVSTLLHQPDPSTHYMDALERFQKDYAQYDKLQREQETQKRNQQIQKRRVSILERQSKRWQIMEDYERKLKFRQQENARLQNSGIKRAANRSGLPYNPINLHYQNNPEGEKLRFYDEQQKIRSYIRAHNMDSKGNCNYNLVNGQDRLGVDNVVPQNLKDRYEKRKNEHIERQKIRLPSYSMKEMLYNHIY